MAITQKSIINDMEETIKNEVYYMIEIKGYTMDNEKEINDKIKAMRKNYSLLLSTMGINKNISISLFSILCDISDKAYSKNDPYCTMLYNLYEKKETIETLRQKRNKDINNQIQSLVG